AARRTDLARAMALLKPRERDLLWLAYAQGSSHQEIAESLGLRTGSIKQLLFRARHRPAGLLGGAGGGTRASAAGNRTSSTRSPPADGLTGAMARCARTWPRARSARRSPRSRVRSRTITKRRGAMRACRRRAASGGAPRCAFARKRRERPLGRS